MEEKREQMRKTVVELSKEMSAAVREVFDLVAKEGRLDPRQAGKILNLLGADMTAEDVLELMETVDVTGDGHLGFDELVFAIAGDHTESTRK